MWTTVLWHTPTSAATVTPVQSIDFRHTAKNEGAQLCGCQHGVVLNDGCPEWNPSLQGTKDQKNLL